MAGLSPGVMSHSDGGGLAVRGRARLEQVRLRFAEMFAQDVEAEEVVRELSGGHEVRASWRARKAAVEAAPASR